MNYIDFSAGDFMRNELTIPSIPNSSIFISSFEKKAREDAFCDIHVHSEFELLKVIDGNIKFSIYGKDYETKRGDIIFVNSQVPHSTVLYKDSSAFFIQFHTDIHPSINDIHLSAYLPHFINIANEDVVIFKKGTDVNRILSSCLDNIKKEYADKEYSYDVFIRGYLHNILAQLYRSNIIMRPEQFFESKNVKKIMPVLEFIDEHYSTKLSLTQLSQIINVNEHYFCRLFKKILNASVFQYINFVRVHKAEELLFSTDKSISEVAFETGFSSLTYFNRTFKKHNYCSPSYYKKIKHNPNA